MADKKLKRPWYLGLTVCILAIFGLNLAAQIGYAAVFGHAPGIVVVILIGALIGVVLAALRGIMIHRLYKLVDRAFPAEETEDETTPMSIHDERR